VRLLAEIAFGGWLVAVWGLTRWQRPAGLLIGSAAACVALAGAILGHGGWALPVLALLAAVTIGATAFEFRTPRS
jgi:hypothetical protein